MTQRLKRNFILLCTAMTGLVLLFACLFAYNYSKSRIESTYQEAFEYQSQSLSVLLATGGYLDHSQIQQMEKTGGIYVFLYDNGRPVPVAGESSGSRAAALAGHMLNLLENGHEGNRFSVQVRYSKPISLTLNFEDQGLPYLGKFVSMPTDRSAWCAFLVIKPLQQMANEISGLQVTYLVIFLLALVVLSLIAWFLAKRSVKPVEQAYQKQTEFIAAASHELKSPMALIASSTDLMEQEPENWKEYLTTVRAENRRMGALVDDLLVLAGSQTGKWRVQQRSQNLEDVLITTYERFLPLASKASIGLEMRLPEGELPNLRVDADRIIQVLSIVLGNAISYSPPGKTIELAVSLKSHTAHIAVIDHGPGIADEDKPRVFDSFYRAEKGRSDKDHFGLGLAVAKELVSLHNGKILLSDTDGGGATFTVVLPAR